jgi:hypothetical protein
MGVDHLRYRYAANNKIATDTRNTGRNLIYLKNMSLIVRLPRSFVLD